MMVPQTASESARELQLRCDLAELDRLGAFIRVIGETEGLGTDQRFALELCLEEAVVNIITHGGLTDRQEPHICVTLLSGAPDLTISLEDDGHAFDPTQAPEPRKATSLEDVQIGGAGIPLMRKLSTSMRYERRHGRNRLILGFGPRSEAAGVNA